MSFIAAGVGLAIIAAAGLGKVAGAINDHTHQPWIEEPSDPQVTAFVEKVTRLGWRLGVMRSYVGKCLPDWTHLTSGQFEIEVFLGRMNTPKAITARGLASFEDGVKNDAGMTCGNRKSSEMTAAFLSGQVRETIMELKDLHLVPTLFFHRGNKT